MLPVTELPLYVFDAPNDLELLDDVQPAKPLPVGLLDPKAWHLPRATRLTDLHADRPFAVAFERWASETLGMWEAAWHYGIDRDEEDIAAVRDAWRAAEAYCQWDGEPKLGRAVTIVDRKVRREAALEPYVGRGLTMRQIAQRTELPLREVVMTLINPIASRRSESYADLEEAILNGGLERTTAQKLLAEHGFKSYDGLRRILKLHGLKRSGRGGWHRSMTVTPQSQGEVA